MSSNPYVHGSDTTHDEVQEANNAPLMERKRPVGPYTAQDDDESPLGARLRKIATDESAKVIAGLEAKYSKPLASCELEDQLDIKSLVDRFLMWRLPQTVASDLCVTDRNYKFPRSGTNLLSATEAEEMLRYVLNAPANTAGGRS